MNVASRFFASALTLLTLPLAAQEAPASVWFDDFDKAVASAKKQGKDLLVDFTGSDWCGWCIKLDAEVFAHAEFVDAMSKKYVLVALDYPRQKPAMDKVPNPVRNAEVSGEYGVGGYPTIMLLTSNGDVLGSASYEEGGPANYVAHLEKVASEGRSNLEFLASYERTLAKAKGGDRLKILRSVVDDLGQMSRESYGVRGMARLAKQAFKLDSRNKKGLKHDAIRAILSAGVADAEVVAVTVKADKKNKLGLRELVALDAMQKVASPEQILKVVALVQGIDKLGIKEDSLAVYLLTNSALWAQEHLKDAKLAKAFAEKAIARGATGKERAQLKKLLE
ncbi:MAG: thioredoxin-related protein [Candidatus Azotimanducaceae bacterium]|jgi:thioredoxin-related protein